MTELRDKEDTLGDLIRELERQPKQSIDFNSFTTASTFSASDFEQPVGGKWNFKQAFDEFTKKRQQAILEANQSNGPINVPPLRKGRVTPELVAGAHFVIQQPSTSLRLLSLTSSSNITGLHIITCPSSSSKLYLVPKF